MEKRIEKQIEIEYYDYEFELDEDECFEIFRDSLQEWVDCANTEEVAEATGVTTFPDVKYYNSWSDADFFEDWLIKTFGNRDTRDASEVVHEFLGNWAEANGFERPAKSHDDADWVADWVTQFMGEPKKQYAVAFTVTDTIAVEARSKEEALEIANGMKMTLVPERMSTWVGDVADCVASDAKFVDVYED